MVKNLQPLLLFFVLLFFGAGPLTAQKSVTVTGQGCYHANANESPANARERALQKAKEDALINAGVPVDVFSYSSIAINSEGVNSQDNYYEMGLFKQMGQVLVKKQEDAPVYEKDGIFTYCCTIQAEVSKVDHKDDPNFSFTTDGIKDTYKDGQNLEFTITPTQNCYLRIFYLAATPNGKDKLLFPDKENYKDFMLEKGTSYVFPPPNKKQFLLDKNSRAQHYPMRIIGESNKTEMGWIVIVALEKDTPFTDEVTGMNINDWLYRIYKSNKQRVKVQNFGVQTEKQ